MEILVGNPGDAIPILAMLYGFTENSLMPSKMRTKDLRLLLEIANVPLTPFGTKSKNFLPALR